MEQVKKQKVEFAKVFNIGAGQILVTKENTQKGSIFQLKYRMALMDYRKE